MNFEDELIADVTKHLLAEVENGGAIGSLYAESLITALAARLVKNYSTAKITTCEYKGKLASVKLQLVIEYINEHLAEDLSLEKLAALCCLSQYHFCRLFKQSMGLTPHQYVTQCRVKAAKQLLTAPKLTIRVISEQLGFAHHSQFSAFFCKYTGITPQTYRQKL